MSDSIEISKTEPRGGGREMTLHASYEELVEKLGVPEDVSRKTYKVDVQWDVEDNHGRELSVWNYKNGPNYWGEDGTPVGEITSWSAGGSEELVEDLNIDYT